MAPTSGTKAATPKILVCEKIAEAGVELLREHGDVDLGLEWSKDDLAERIGAYQAIVVRSATKVTADLIAKAEKLRVVGRAGTGVDNVDVEAATRRGIIVCNAPESNSVSAAEHAIALMLAQARNVAQAHSSLVDGRWERSKFGGMEVTDKTLGILGFGRIGQMVAERARGLQMNVIAYDPFVADSRFREVGVERAEKPEDLYAVSDIVSLHMASTPETRGILNAAAFAAMKKGARVINAARGDLIDVDALVAAVESGHLGGAAIDVYAVEPTTESPLFGLPGVVVTPHLGASTTEAQDRAGVDVAKQVVAALTGGVVTSAVNIPSISAEALAVVGPFLPLAKGLGKLITVLTGGRMSPLEIVAEGALAEQDGRILTSAVLTGIMRGHVEEDVNMVNAGSLAKERGIEWTEISSPAAPIYTNRLTLRAGPAGSRVEISGTTVGATERPRLVSVFGQEIEIELAQNIGIFLYKDVPGMIGKVGTILGAAKVNIASMAVSRSSEEGQAVMAVTMDSPAPPEVAAEIGGIDGFASVWFATLD
jgi:D-3-phosphoglycerate dehydrogenase / 2-oxoglutarate reductase